MPVERFAESLTRTPGLRDRLFTPDEQLTPSGNPRTGESLAARFAAKEALAKALGAPGDLHWHDAEVSPSASTAGRASRCAARWPAGPRSSASRPGTSRSATTAASPRRWSIARA